MGKKVIILWVKKNHSPNSRFDNANLNIEVQQNSKENGQVPNNNSPQPSNKSNLNFQII
jgi:hypothetical protein